MILTGCIGEVFFYIDNIITKMFARKLFLNITEKKPVFSDTDKIYNKSNMDELDYTSLAIAVLFFILVPLNQFTKMFIMSRPPGSRTVKYNTSLLK